MNDIRDVVDSNRYKTKSYLHIKCMSLYVCRIHISNYLKMDLYGGPLVTGVFVDTER